jgi:hypothetical protein
MPNARPISRIIIRVATQEMPEQSRLSLEKLSDAEFFIERNHESGIARVPETDGDLYFARAELRRAGDVSPLILRVVDNQGINIPRSPKTDLNLDRSQNSWAQVTHFKM